MKMNRGILLVIGLMLSQAYVGQSMAMNGTRVEFESGKCPICTDDLTLTNRLIPTCGHTHCLDCFADWRFVSGVGKGCSSCRQNADVDHGLTNPANRVMALIDADLRQYGKPLGLKLAEAMKFNDRRQFGKAVGDLELLQQYANSNSAIRDLAKRVIANTLSYNNSTLDLSVRKLIQGNEDYIVALEQIKVK